MVYKHAYLNTYLLLHSAFMLSVVKMPLKGKVGGHALKSHGNYIVDHGKSWNCVFEFLKRAVARAFTVNYFDCLHVDDFT